MVARMIDVRAGIVGLAVVALLGLAGCGDDDGGGGALDVSGEGGEDGGGDGGSGVVEAAPDTPGAALEACSLLERSEVEAQFGEFGAVGEGQTIPRGCEWQVGEEIEGAIAPPTLSLQFMYHPDERFATFYPNGYPEAELDDVRAQPELVEVPGLGDEAFVDFAILYVISGETVVALAAYMIPGATEDLDVTREKLIAVGQTVVDRL